MAEQQGVISTPIGKLRMVADAEGLGEIRFETQFTAAEHKMPCNEYLEPGLVRDAADQLLAYFAGERQAFDLPLCPHGTEFQLRVWSELRNIPYGETVSYGEIARRIGASNAARAVGAANGRNPLPIFVPCHRVIGGDGSLTGFGGGLSIKRKLLALEQQAELQQQLEFVEAGG